MVMVLIVEDEAISRKALQQLLRLHGLDACAAGSGEEAMRMVAWCGRPTMALVDINLPGMDGVEFVRQLHRRYPSLPCIYMTANDEAVLEQVRAASPEPTLRKPFDVPSLLHMIVSASDARSMPAV
jgi:two-component system response regulator (stage 0 sporulation protein F)